MAVWGFYYDIFNFGLFDFIGLNSEKSEHCQNSGIVIVFKSLGYLIAPLIAAYLIVGQAVGSTPFIYAFVFMIIAAVFYVLLSGFSSHRGIHEPVTHIRKSVGWQKELYLWKNVSSILFPVLVFNTMLFIFDATFWTIGPLFSQNFKNFANFGGLFMTAYTLPTLFTGWFIENITRKFGKKRTAYISFLFCSFTLVLVGFLKNPILVILTTLISSFFGSLAWPAINGAYVDYLTESKKYQNEIEGLNDFTTNIGYVIGPIFAGFAADLLGISLTFTFLGVFNIFLVALLIAFTPKHIRIALKGALT